MTRVLAFLYGIAAYSAGFVALLYMIGFTEGIVVPKHAPALPRSIRSIRVATVREAIDRVGLGGA